MIRTTESLLARLSQNPLSESTSLSPLQNRVDQGVTHFVHHTLNPAMLGAMLSGQFASQFSQLVLGSFFQSMRWGNPLFQILRTGSSIGAETFAFESTHRLLTRAPLSENFQQDFMRSALNFSLLRTQHLLPNQNIILRHLATDTAMITGNHLSREMGWITSPHTSLFEEVLESESMQIQQGLALSLTHQAFPSIRAFERSLHFSLPSSSSTLLLSESLKAKALNHLALATETGNSNRFPEINIVLAQGSAPMATGARNLESTRATSDVRELQPSQPQTSHPYETLPWPVFEKSQNGEIIYFNASARELLKAAGITEITQANDLLTHPFEANIYRLGPQHFLAFKRAQEQEGGSTLLFFEEVSESTRMAMENRALRDSTFQLSLLAGKAGFALGSIHDVNNMLQAAQIGLAYLLRKDPDNRAVQNIAEAVDRGIQNFTNMKGILNGNKEIRSISLTKAIEVSQRLAEKNLRDRDITVSTDFEEASFVLHGNEGMLVQAIYNMMINASHAMPQGGQLTLRLRRQSTNIVFEMEDTGTGIAPEHLSHIFDLNFTTKGNQGNGIGLYMVKQIIENIHQGTIEVQSTPGSGTTFRITLPQQRRPSILPQNRQ